MKEEKVMLNNLFSWQDVINFSLTDYLFGYNFLEKSCSKKNSGDTFIHYVRSFIGNKLRKEFPDFPFDDECFNYYFYIKKNQEGKNSLYLNFSNFFIDLFISSANRRLDQRRLAHLLNTNNPTLKEDVIRELRTYKSELNDEIDRCNSQDIMMGYNLEYNIKITRDQLKEALFEKRKMINWVIRHYDGLYDFIQKPLDLDVLNLLNKDKFMLVMVAMTLEKSGILRDDTVIPKQEFIQIIHNYLLLVDYLSMENNQKYSASFSTELKNGQLFLIAADTISLEYHKFYSKHRELINSYHFASNYEELLRDRAEETWKRLHNEKIVKSIQVNWEMIPSGEKVSLNHSQRNRMARISSNSDDKKQAELKKAYDLVEEKMNYFYNSNPVVNLKGINTFEGYEAYMYSNGMVVFEKFYRPKTIRIADQAGKKEQKIIMVPVDGEAIYVMNFRNFAEYSKYSKSMLIEESFHSSEVKRIIHTPNGSWKDRVDGVIHGPGYGELDLEQVDEIAKQLAKRV